MREPGHCAGFGLLCDLLMGISWQPLPPPSGPLAGALSPGFTTVDLDCCTVLHLCCARGTVLSWHEKSLDATRCHIKAYEWRIGDSNRVPQVPYLPTTCGNRPIRLAQNPAQLAPKPAHFHPIWRRSSPRGLTSPKMIAGPCWTSSGRRWQGQRSEASTKCSRGVARLPGATRPG